MEVAFEQISAWSCLSCKCDIERRTLEPMVLSKTGDIDALSTNNLTFLGAVIQEALRMYPPLPLGMPRIIPQGGDTVDGHYLPAGVSYETLNGQHALLTLIDTSVNKPTGSNHECKELPRSLGLSPRKVDWKK